MDNESRIPRAVISGIYNETSGLRGPTSPVARILMGMLADFDFDVALSDLIGESTLWETVAPICRWL
jgi:hypothetical protein